MDTDRSEEFERFKYLLTKGYAADRPYMSAAERFYDFCQYIQILVLRYLRLNSFRILSDNGSLSPEFASIPESLHVTGFSADTSGDAWLTQRAFPSAGDIEQKIDELKKVTEFRTNISHHQNFQTSLRLESLQSKFGLSDLELTLLCAVAAPQINEEVKRLYQLATGLKSSLFPGWFYAALLWNPDVEAIDIYKCLGADSPLRMFCLVEIGRQTDWGGRTPVSQAPISVPNRIASYLIGYDADCDLPYAVFRDAPKGELALSEHFKKSTARLLKRPAARIGFYGPKGFGRRSFVCEYAFKNHQSVLEIDLSKLSPDETKDSLTNTMAMWFREARLQDVILFFKCDHQPSTEIENLLIQTAPQFNEMLEQHPGAVCFTAKTQSAWIRTFFGDHAEIYCPMPSRADQPELWRRALEEALSEEQIEDTVQYISSSYCLTPGEIYSAVQSTQERLGNDDITAESLAETLRTTRGQELASLAELKSTPLGINDIVLNADERKIIDDILRYARYSETVRNDWGFARMSDAAGLSVLFSGPPGTGKTLTAGVIAHELRRALYVVDISRVVDKYIGETEKRLAKIFDYAQQSQAIILFDEADSLFAKRTNVKSSNDRYANLEVNYLLQRLEAYNGVTILTTNLASSLDDALARRISFKLTFPMPEPAERAKLWQVLIPRKAPKSNIDYMRLAECFEMSGGNIKNAVFRACIFAASREIPLDTEILYDAAMHEFREMGHVVRDGEHEDRETHWI